MKSDYLFTSESVTEGDPDHRCDMFFPGTPNNGGCQGDGHYLCSQCILKESDHVLRDHK